MLSQFFDDISPIVVHPIADVEHVVDGGITVLVLCKSGKQILDDGDHLVVLDAWQFYFGVQVHSHPLQEVRGPVAVVENERPCLLVLELFIFDVRQTSKHANKVIDNASFLVSEIMLTVELFHSFLLQQNRSSQFISDLLFDGEGKTLVLVH